MTDDTSPYDAVIAAMSDTPFAKVMLAKLKADKAMADIIIKPNTAMAAKIKSIQDALKQMVESTPAALKMPAAPLQKEPDEMRELAHIWFLARTFTHEDRGWSKSQFVDAFERIAGYAETLGKRGLGEKEGEFSNYASDADVVRDRNDFAPLQRD